MIGKAVLCPELGRAAWKYASLLSLRSIPSSGVICGPSSILRIACLQKKNKSRGALETGARTVGLMRFTCLQTVPPTTTPVLPRRLSGLTLLDPAIVMVLKCGPPPTASALSRTC